MTGFVVAERKKKVFLTTSLSFQNGQQSALYGAQQETQERGRQWLRKNRSFVKSTHNIAVEVNAMFLFHRGINCIREKSDFTRKLGLFFLMKRSTATTNIE